MKQLQDAINNKNIYNCRSIIIASIRQDIINKSEFTQYLQECLNEFGNDFFDIDDGLIIKNNKEDLFASIKVNFSQKKTNQLLVILPDIQEKIHAKSPKKIIIITTIIIVLIIIAIFSLSSSNNDKTLNTTQNNITQE